MVSFDANAVKDIKKLNAACLLFFSCRRWLISLWPRVEGDELYSSSYMHMKIKFVKYDGESLKFITFVGFRFRVVERMDNLSLHVVISLCHICIRHPISSVCCEKSHRPPVVTYMSSWTCFGKQMTAQRPMMSIFSDSADMQLIPT